jgi:hypothetical protein
MKAEPHNFVGTNCRGQATSFSESLGSGSALEILAALTYGLGDIPITLSVVHLEMNKEISAQNLTVSFPDPLQVINLRWSTERGLAPSPLNMQR